MKSREIHEHREFYRVEEIEGALFLSSSLAVQGEPEPPSQPSPYPGLYLKKAKQLAALADGGHQPSLEKIAQLLEEQDAKR